MNELTRGEALVQGIEQIRRGLEMIQEVGSRADLVKVLVGSTAATRRLHELLDSDLFRAMVVELVAARNGKLAEGTVRKVIDDFLGVLMDLSQPYRPPAGGEDSPHE